MRMTVKKKLILGTIIKRKKGLTPTQIGEKLGYPRHQESARCCPVLNQFVQAGFVERDDPGVYRVTDEGRVWYKENARQVKV
jgi:predicted transcriptional regulator